MEKDEKEEDTYDVLVASHLALEDYEEVLLSCQRWVDVCGNSLKQLQYTLEAAYMLEEKSILEDAAIRLCFLYDSSMNDPVFFNAALLACALVLDVDLPFPETMSKNDAVLNESNDPLAFWIKSKLGEKMEEEKFESMRDEQAKDRLICLKALLLFEREKNEEKAKALFESDQAIDATGLIARYLFKVIEEKPDVPMSRVHPLFRKRM